MSISCRVGFPKTRRATSRSLESDCRFGYNQSIDQVVRLQLIVRRPPDTMQPCESCSASASSTMMFTQVLYAVPWYSSTRSLCRSIGERVLGYRVSQTQQGTTKNRLLSGLGTRLQQFTKHRDNRLLTIASCIGVRCVTATT